MEKKTRRRWTTDQKQAIAARAHQRVAAGEGVAAVAAHLGVCENSLRLWMRQHSPKQFLEVELDEAVPAASSGTISLTTPSGLRFDALDVGDVLVLLEQLQ
jgi:transposase-like protein